MTLRLAFFIFIFLMITLISHQIPLSVLQYDAARIKFPNIPGPKFKVKEEKTASHRVKRQVNVDGLGSQHHNQDSILKQISSANERNKRLEAEELSVADGNQFYKPVGEESKESHPLFSFSQDKEEGPDHKIADDLSASAKLEVAPVVRTQRQGAMAEYAVLDSRTNSDNLLTKDQRPQHTSGESNNDEVCPLRKGRDNSESLELSDNHYLSLETLETMKKINPLTIGNQVSQMIHDRKCGNRKKLMGKTNFGCHPISGLQNEDQFVSQNEDPSVSFSQDNDDSGKHRTSCDKQQPQKSAQKQCGSKDYGFSVIILAGDPLKVMGTGARCENASKEENTSKDKQRGNEGECRISNDSNGKNTLRSGKSASGKELRVQKIPNANVDFPVYDQDLSDVPDPFNGILEQNYWADSAIQGDRSLSFVGAQALTRHTIRVRGVQKKNGNKNANNNSNGLKNGSPGPDSNGADMSQDISPVTESADTPQPELEPFGDLTINMNKTSCLSWREPEKDKEIYIPPMCNRNRNTVNTAVGVVTQSTRRQKV